MQMYEKCIENPCKLGLQSSCKPIVNAFWQCFITCDVIFAKQNN